MQVSLLESALYVDDLEVSKKFYAQLLDREPYRDEPDRHCFFKLENNMLLLFDARKTIVPSDLLPIPTHGASGQGHLCLSSEPMGLTYWKNRLETLGIEIECHYTWDNGAQSLYFPDPSKNSLEIAEPRLWEF